MEIAIGLTAAILVLFPIIGAIAGDDGERVWTALAGLYVGAWASFWVWVIYVIAHFVAKFW